MTVVLTAFGSERIELGVWLVTEMGKECRDMCFPLAAFVVFVVNDHADKDFRIDPSTEVIHDEPSFRACISSVEKDLRRFLSSSAGHESISKASLSLSRLRKICKRVATRKIKKPVEMTVMTERYTATPPNKEVKPASARRAAAMVPVQVMPTAGSQRYKCLGPNEMGRPSRT